MTTFSQHHLHFRRPARKIRRIFRWTKRTIFQWRRAKLDHRQAFMWKIGAFCGGFLGKNPLDFVEFFAADGDEIFTGAVGAEGSGKAPCSIMLSSEMHKSQADAIIREGGFSRTILPPFIRWILPLWGSWCGCLGPDNLSPPLGASVCEEGYGCNLRVVLPPHLKSLVPFQMNMSQSSPRLLSI